MSAADSENSCHKDDAALAPATSAAVNKFGWELLSRAIAQNPSANIGLSPSSIATALAMVAAGASDETLAELSQALQFADACDCVRELSLMARSLAGGRKNAALACPNGIFFDRTLQLNEEFQGELRSKFLAEVKSKDFKDNAESCRDSINSWVSSRTNSKIPEALPRGSVDADTSLLLVNAVHFKADWFCKFEDYASYDGHFESSEADSTPARMMRQADFFRCSETQHLRTLVKYLTGDCECVLILPVRRHGLDQALHEAGGVCAALDQAKNKKRHFTTLHLPKMKIECQLNLHESGYLPDCGVVRAFKFGRAQLNKMSNKPLFVSQVVHKAVLKFDEEGVEAAAVTGGCVAACSSNTEFKVDQPFVAAIRDRATGCLLFLAKVYRPERASGAGVSVHQ